MYTNISAAAGLMYVRMYSIDSISVVADFSVVVKTTSVESSGSIM